MATVQSMMLKLVERIDPYCVKADNSTAEFSLSTSGTAVGTVNGTRFTAQRQLDIYNDARYELLSYLQFKIPPTQLAIMVQGTVKDAGTLHASGGVITLPSDYFAVAALSSNGPRLYLVPATYMHSVRRGWNPYRTESSDQVFLMPAGKTFYTLSTNTYLTDAMNVYLTYWAMSAFSLSDVTGGSTAETLDEPFYMPLLQIAEAISNEMNRQQLNSVIESVTAGL